MPASAPKSPLEQRGIDFLSWVNSKYHAIQPAFPLLNSTQIQSCSDPWALQVNEMNALAEGQLPEATAQQLIFFDRFGVTTIQEAVQNMEANFNCIQPTMQFYFKMITDLSTSPETAWTATVGFINQLYAEGGCTVLHDAAAIQSE
jgi:hypothetical protein